MAYESISGFFNETIGGRLEKNPDRAKKVGGVFEFVISGDQGGTWSVNLKTATMQSGAGDTMDCRIRMKDADFLDLINSRLNPMQAFTSGKLKVEGNIALSLKLTQLLDPKGW